MRNTRLPADLAQCLSNPCPVPTRTNASPRLPEVWDPFGTHDLAPDLVAGVAMNVRRYAR
jgi:hypothetical protein